MLHSSSNLWGYLDTSGKFLTMAPSFSSGNIRNIWILKRPDFKGPYFYIFREGKSQERFEEK